MIERSEFRGIHLAPYTLTVAAQFAILTRLVESQICPNVIKKMKYYNGEAVADKEKDQVDLLQLYQEGKKKAEGMSGISPRFVVNALNVALGQKETVKCVNPLDAIRAMSGTLGKLVKDDKLYTEVKDTMANLKEREALLAVILAPQLEIALKQSLALSQGSYLIFFGRPIALAFMILAFGCDRPRALAAVQEPSAGVHRGRGGLNDLLEIPIATTRK
jgi:hypothetical protein